MGYYQKLLLRQTRGKRRVQLTEKEKIILHAIEHQAMIPIPSIAKQTRLKAHTVRYHIANLKERNIILGKAPFINPYPLGFTDYTFYFSLAASSARKSHELLTMFKEQEGVTWVATLGGEFQAGVAICARRIENVSALLGSVSKKFGDVFFQKSMSVRTRFVAFGRKYLGSTAKSLVLFAVELKGQGGSTIDETDHKLLGALSNLEFVSQRQLARAVGLPFSTVERRIDNLKKAGILLGYIYRYRLVDTGLQTYRLLISTRGLAAGLSDRLFAFAADHPHILHYIECMGAWDYEMSAEVERPADVNGIIRQLYEEFGSDINSVKFLQIFEHLKYSAYPFRNIPAEFD